MSPNEKATNKSGAKKEFLLVDDEGDREDNYASEHHRVTRSANI